MFVPACIRLPFCLVAVAAAELDASALMQRQKRGQMAVRETASSNALQGILQTATRMLRLGATPEVVSFAEDTMKAIKSEVVPAIERDHAANVALLKEHFDALASFAQSQDATRAKIEEAWTAINEAGAEHHQCRFLERSQCNESRICDAQLEARWDVVQELEEDLDEIGGSIEGVWCEPGSNRTLVDFRDTAVTKFTKYINKREKVKESWKSYEEVVPACHAQQKKLLEQRDDCDDKQRVFESASCAAESMRMRVFEEVEGQWPILTSIYSTTVESIKKSEADRKKEYVTLTVVECLLDKIDKYGGKPCEEAGGDATAEINGCHDLSVNQTRLDIVYQDLLPKPVVPEAKPVPCKEDFVSVYQFGDCIEVAPCAPCMDAKAAHSTASLLAIPQ